MHQCRLPSNKLIINCVTGVAWAGDEASFVHVHHSGSISVHCCLHDPASSGSTAQTKSKQKLQVHARHLRIIGASNSWMRPALFLKTFPV